MTSVEKRLPNTLFSETRRPILVRREWLHVAILTIVMVFVWIAINIYLVLFKRLVPDPLKRRLQLFSIQVDESAIDELSSRRTFFDETLTEEQRIILELDRRQTVEIPSTSSSSAATPTATPTTPGG